MPRVLRSSCITSIHLVFEPHILIYLKHRKTEKLMLKFVCAEFVCPTLGYREFLHADWLVQILSWQKPIGCWGVMKDTGRSEDDKHEFDGQAERKSVAATKNGDDSQRDIDAGLAPPVFRTRKLLYEKVISGNFCCYWDKCVCLCQLHVLCCLSLCRRLCCSARRRQRHWQIRLCHCVCDVDI